MLDLILDQATQSQHHLLLHLQPFLPPLPLPLHPPHLSLLPDPVLLGVLIIQTLNISCTATVATYCTYSVTVCQAVSVSRSSISITICLCSVCHRALCGELHTCGPCPWPTCTMHDPVRFAKRCEQEQARAEAEAARWRKEHAKFLGQKRKREEGGAESVNDNVSASSPSFANDNDESISAPTRHSTRHRKIKRTESRDVAEQIARGDAEKIDPDKMRCPVCRNWDTDPFPEGSRLGQWVQCGRNECRQWWHAEHAEVNEERFERIRNKEEEFVCPVCTFPWLSPSYWSSSSSTSASPASPPPAAATAASSASTQSDSTDAE